MKSTLYRLCQLSSNESKWFWFVNSCSLVLFLSIYFLFLTKDDLTLFPNNNSVSISFFADQVDNGNSFIENSFVTDSTINFEFKLGMGYRFPYAGVDLEFINQGVDVSDYNRILVDFSSDNLGHMWLFANMKDFQIKDTSLNHAIRRTSTDLQIEQKRQTSIIKLENFDSPDWWYNEVNQQKKDFNKPDWKQVVGISFISGLNIKPDQVCKFNISQIKFVKDNTLPISTMLIVQMVVLLISGYVFLTPKPKPEQLVQTMEITYKPIENIAIPKQSTERFLIYIHENFSDPDLSLSKIAKQTGTSPRTISDTFSEKYNINLKNYINQIRINEAKRLLIESDLNINQIAYQVGFNSPANFNRVFKKLTSKSPTEFLQDIGS